MAEITSPIKKRIKIKGMGLTVPTESDGVEAEVVVVDSLEELRLNKHRVNSPSFPDKSFFNFSI